MRGSKGVSPPFTFGKGRRDFQPVKMVNVVSVDFLTILATVAAAFLTYQLLRRLVGMLWSNGSFKGESSISSAVSDGPQAARQAPASRTSSYEPPKKRIFSM